jgi:phosphofructokinase-like protein
MTKRIGILTGGGDAPGLNAVIRAVVKVACGEYGWEVFGIEQGFDGLVTGQASPRLTPDSVRGILPKGGTILGAASRGNPFARPVEREGKTTYVDASDLAIARLDALGIDALIVVGGDGTMKISQELAEKGVHVVGVPKTIDNDIDGTNITFGYDTAVQTATDALDKLHTTAESHHRVMILEVMGRNAGWIALESGMAGSADIILIPEIPFRMEPLVAKIDERRQIGRFFSIAVVAEGACPEGGDQVFRIAGDPLTDARLGGIGQMVGDRLAELSDTEVRVTVLGHLQRGGSPTAFDRWLATRFGAGAVHLVAREGWGRMVALRDTKITDLPITEAISKLKRVDPDGEPIHTARGLGVVFGDENV